MNTQNPDQNFGVPSTIENVPAIKPSDLPSSITPSIQTPSITPQPIPVVNIALPSIENQTANALDVNQVKTKTNEEKELEKAYVDAKNLSGGNAFALMNEINKDIFGATPEK